MECVNYVLRFWIMMVVVSLVVLEGWEVKSVSGGMSAAQCHEERRLGVIACNNIAYGGSPSAFCCQRIRVSHVECVCPVITKKFAFVDINHYIRIVQGCGRRVPHHFKCGRYSPERNSIAPMVFLLLVYTIIKGCNIVTLPSK